MKIYKKKNGILLMFNKNLLKAWACHAVICFGAFNVTMLSASTDQFDDFLSAAKEGNTAAVHASTNDNEDVSVDGGVAGRVSGIADEVNPLVEALTASDVKTDMPGGREESPASIVGEAGYDDCLNHLMMALMITSGENDNQEQKPREYIVLRD